MLKLFAFLLMSIMIASCGGGGKSTATLTIGRGFFLNNSGFSGGIYISGFKNDGTEEFLTAIPTGNSANVSISQGVWDFKVIGWDGGGVMQGTAYCAVVNDFVFDEEGKVLPITVSEGNCFNSQISGANQQVTANVGPYKQLVVNSCGSMHNPSDTSQLNALGYFNPCVDVNYLTEFRKTYSYYKIDLVNQDVLGNRTAGLTSACLNANTGQPVLFPNRIPVALTFYSDSGCTQVADEFKFTKGLDFSQSPARNQNAFDWSVTADSAYFFVTVANGASKRGTTAFQTETPQFKCKDGGNLVPCPKLAPASANTYYLDPDTYAVIKVPQGTCSNPSFSPGLSVTVHSCDAMGGNIYFGLKVNSTATANGSMTLNGSTYNLKVGNITTGLSNDRVRDAYKTMKRVLGYRNEDALNDSLQDDFDEGDNAQIGLLDPAIYEISSMGAGGVFYDYFAQCSTSALPQVSRFYKKNGITYTVSLSGISGNAPGFTARNEEPEFLGTEVHYNRRIVVRKLLGGIYTTEKIIDISCDNDDTGALSYVSSSAQVRNGKMEEQRLYNLGTKEVNLKKIIFWNTSSSDSARFDVYRSKVVKLGGTLQKAERNFYRAVKADSDTYNDFKIHGMSYEVVREGSAYDESIYVNEIDGKTVSGNLSYSHKRLLDYKIEDTTVGTIFSTTFAGELQKIRFGFSPAFYEVEQPKVSSTGSEFVEARRSGGSLQLRFTNLNTFEDTTDTISPDNIATDISINGLYKIVATNSGTTLKYFVINGSTVTPSSINTNYDLADLKAVILNDGTYVISYLEIHPTFGKQLFWSVNGGAATSSPYYGSSAQYHSIEMTKDSSMAYLMGNRTNMGTIQYIDVCKLNPLQTCGFLDAASRVSSNPFTYASFYLSNGSLHYTYIHDGAPYSVSGPTSTLFTGTQTTFSPLFYKFTGYNFNQYTSLSSSVILRSSTTADIEVSYPFYNPTIPAFQMRPSSLNQATYDGLYMGGFNTVTN